MEFAQKLLSTRRGSLYVAVLAALLAGVAILVYVNQYRHSLNAGNTPVTVLVAKQAIAKGTSGQLVASKNLFTATTIRESQLRDGAFSDIASLRGKVATRDIYEGSQLTAADFSANATSLASDITARQRVMSVPLDSAHGLIGQLEVGNHVDVYAVVNIISINADGSPKDGGQTRAIVKKILNDIKVVAVSTSGAAGSRTTNVSLLLDDKQASDLALASDKGSVWVALRPSAGAKSVKKPEIASIETMMLGVPPAVVVASMGGRP